MRNFIFIFSVFFLSGCDEALKTTNCNELPNSTSLQNDVREKIHAFVYETGTPEDEEQRKLFAQFAKDIEDNAYLLCSTNPDSKIGNAVEASIQETVFRDYVGPKTWEN